MNYLANINLSYGDFKWKNEILYKWSQSHCWNGKHDPYSIVKNNKKNPWNQKANDIWP